MTDTPFKMGTVDSLFPDGSPKVKFDGETTPSQKKYKRLASYTPSVGDRVVIASVSGTYVVLGKTV